MSKSFFHRLKIGLSRTSEQLLDGLGNLMLGKKQLDAELLEALTDRLVVADVGIMATQKLMLKLAEQMKRSQSNDLSTLISHLQQLLIAELQPSEIPLIVDRDKIPFVILMIGINGAGKTTTVGKLAKYFQTQGKSVMLAAGDTFRAGAVEQLQSWGERNHVAVIAQPSGADPAAVIYDALAAARARRTEVLLVDTAGRLHTQQNLMAELGKTVRVLKKLDPTAPHEVMLVLDGNIGQHALTQIREFSATVPVSGITVTKLDGTARGGILVAMAEQTGLPIRFIGMGEAIDDLQVFTAATFVKAMLATP